ncbi:MAG: hypothetical protein IIX10_01185 [Clostridia bacterium]|nr:hypothetical protein [Clostridia bacterium]
MNENNTRKELDIPEETRKNHPGSAPLAPAVEIEIHTTKNEEQKTELSRELFPHIPRSKRMRTHRVMH